MSRPKGSVEIKADRCKGCGLCVASCPTKSLQMGKTFNRLGYHAAMYLEKSGCTGCGLCFYACPEPDAIAVTKTKEEDAA